MKSLKNILASTLVLASTALPLKAETPKPFVQGTFASDYVAPSGVIIPGECFQTWTSIDPIKNVTLGIFQDFAFDSNTINERDYCISARKNLSDSVSVGAGFQYWSYPTDEFGQFDSIESADIKYSGSPNLSLSYTRLNRNSGHPGGDGFNASISKSIPFLESGKTKLSLAPFASAYWAENFFGLNGLTNVRGGLGLDLSRGNFNVNASVTRQETDNESLADKTFYSISVGYQF